MKNNEVENLPSGIVTCLINGRELKILKISLNTILLRASDKVDNINVFKMSYFIFKENKYKEITIDKYKLIKEESNEFYYTYYFSIEDEEFKKYTKYIFKDYSTYVTLKNYGCDNEFSQEMVGYPAEKDYDFYHFFKDQKRDLLSCINYNYLNKSIISSVDFALCIHNDNMYKSYLENDLETFWSNYLKENYVYSHKLFMKIINRIYIGNEFCHNLFPNINMLKNLLNKALKDNLEITICFTYLRDSLIDKTKEYIDVLYDFSVKNNKKIEIVINDWGMIELLKGKEDYFSYNLGVLLNKRKKDPRYLYKNGYEESRELLSYNSLNYDLFSDFLKENNILRYEYESCGYKIKIAEGNHSLHIPYYQTNTSQFCPLYAMCTNLDRGKQKFVDKCPKFCTDYVFTYPKHLKMVGMYNSLFAFDSNILSDEKYIEYYINNNIDRIVLNFM